MRLDYYWGLLYKLTMYEYMTLHSATSANASPAPVAALTIEKLLAEIAPDVLMASSIGAIASSSVTSGAEMDLRSAFTFLPPTSTSTGALG